MSATNTIETLRKTLIEVMKPENVAAATAVVKSLADAGASEQEIVRALRAFIPKPTLNDALAKALDNPGTEVTVSDRGVTVEKRNASVTVREGEPLGSLSSGSRTIDPGLFVDTMVAAKRRRGRDDDRLQKAREDLAAAYGGEIAVKNLEKSRKRRLERRPL